jgi:hypothetical protein
MDTRLFFALLIAFLIVMELGRPLIRAEQERAGLEPAPRRRRLLIDIGWYGAVSTAVVGYWLGIEIARYLLGFLFLGAGAGAALSIVLWIGTKFRPLDSGEDGNQAERSG